MQKKMWAVLNLKFTRNDKTSRQCHFMPDDGGGGGEKAKQINFARLTGDQQMYPTSINE